MPNRTPQAGAQMDQRLPMRVWTARHLMLVIVIVTFGAQRVAFGLSWSDKMYVSRGLDVSLTLDSQGRPHIAFTAMGIDQYLRYTMFDGTSWNTQVVDDRWQAKGYPSLVLDSSGRPRISYWLSLGCDLQYAEWDGASWQIQTVDTAGNTGQQSTLVLDGQDRPHICYIASYLDIKYSAWDGSNWQHKILGENPCDLSMVRDAAGTIHIAYRDLSYGLTYGTWNGAAWSTHAVDNNGQYAGSSCSLALDSQGRPHISYIADNDVRYASWDGMSWIVETVDADENQAGATSLAIDGLDRPHFCYYGQRDLKYAYYDGDSWAIDILDTCGSVGPTSLTLDAWGLPHIAYEVNDSRTVYYIRAIPEPTTLSLLALGALGLLRRRRR